MTWFHESDFGRAVLSYIKTFAAVVLGLFIADGADVFSVDATDLRTWVSAGLAAVLPLIITALDPQDTRFGRGSLDEAEEEFDAEGYQGE